jgi:hypothetical protein
MSSTILLALNVEAMSIATLAVGHMINYMHYHVDQGNAIGDGQVWSSDDCECPPQPQFNFVLIQATKDQVVLLTDADAKIAMWRSDVFLANALTDNDDNRILLLVPMTNGETARAAEDLDYARFRAIADDLIRTPLSERRNGLFGTVGGGGLERRVVSPHKCANSGCVRVTPNMMHCNQCRQTRYCSRECQVKHWPIHKIVCMQCMGCGAARGVSGCQCQCMSGNNVEGATTSPVDPDLD